MDDLENRGRRKNLRIVGLPEGAEGSGTLASFLHSSFPKCLELNTDSLTLEIEGAHRSPTFVSRNSNSSPRSILFRFLQFIDKETVLRAALKKKITHDGTELRFYSDLSTGVLQKRCEFNAVGVLLGVCIVALSTLPGLDAYTRERSACLTIRTRRKFFWTFLDR